MVKHCGIPAVTKAAQRGSPSYLPESPGAFPKSRGSGFGCDATDNAFLLPMPAIEFGPALAAPCSFQTAVKVATCDRSRQPQSAVVLLRHLRGGWRPQRTARAFASGSPTPFMAAGGSLPDPAKLRRPERTGRAGPPAHSAGRRLGRRKQRAQGMDIHRDVGEIGGSGIVAVRAAGVDPEHERRPSERR